MSEKNIEIIERQTDLNRIQIIELLKKYDDNVEKVIRHYLNNGKQEINNNNKKNNSLNQRIFGEIRDYMDNVMDLYNKRKKNAENKEIDNNFEIDE